MVRVEQCWAERVYYYNVVVVNIVVVVVVFTLLMSRHFCVHNGGVLLACSQLV